MLRVKYFYTKITRAWASGTFRERSIRFLVTCVRRPIEVSIGYLLAFPNKRVRLFGEGSVSVSSSDEYDIAIFPHYAISQLSDSSVDLFYNANSFSEMDGATSREYLSIIERTCRKYFLHDNHDAIFKFEDADGSTSTNVIGSNLIPNPVLFKRIFKRLRVHGLPEDRSLVQYEYLYKKMNPTLKVN
jgi:hypothetical protein